MIVKRRERLEKVLLNLDNLGFATREQLQHIHDLGGKRNANKVLQGMSAYLNIKRHPERDCCNVYYLNKEGRQYIDSPKERKYSSEVEHYLMRNDMFIHFGCPDDFITDQSIAFGRRGEKEKLIRPDARFTHDQRLYLLEVDRTQSMRKNKEKLEMYADLMDVMKDQFAYLPRVVFYTETDSRKELLVKEGGKYGLDIQVITKEETKKWPSK